MTGMPVHEPVPVYSTTHRLLGHWTPLELMDLVKMGIGTEIDVSPLDGGGAIRCRVENYSVDSLIQATSITVTVLGSPPA